MTFTFATTTLEMASALLGAAGTVLLYKGTFGLVPGPGAYADDALLGAIRKQNARLRLLQRIGLGLLTLSFLCAFVHVFAEAPAPAPATPASTAPIVNAPAVSSVWLSVGSALGGAVGAAFGWTISSFFGTPLRKFYDLRGDVIRQLTNFANVRAAMKQDRADGTLKPVPDFNDEDAARLNQAQAALRDLASQLRAFSENEPLAMMFLRLRYNPVAASGDLLGLSNTYATYGADRAHFRAAISKSLRIT